jgi:hypothetical protein
MDSGYLDDCGYIHCYRCNKEAESFEEKCHSFRQLSDRCVERSTIHLHNIQCLQRNFRTLKRLKNRNNEPNFGTSHAFMEC